MTHVYETCCPHCGYANTRASAIVKKEDKHKAEPIPTDGCISVCVRCGDFSIFSYMTPGGLRKPQPEERETILRASDIARMIETLRWRAEP